MSTPVPSPVVGTVWKIEVDVGATVDLDQVLMILESMKMEIPIEAEQAGIVSSIAVSEGEAVTERQLLATID